MLTPKREDSFIIFSPSDSVGVALVPLKKGEEAAGIKLVEDIGQGHKFALKEIKKDEPVIKYGEVFGRATMACRPAK